MIAWALSISSSRLARTCPWSRKASSVAGGMVFTVPGPMISSTYRTSRYCGFFILVLPQGRRCRWALLSTKAFQRAPRKISLER